MIATTPPAAAQPPHRPAAADGPRQPPREAGSQAKPADRPSVIVELSPLAAARYAEAANQVDQSGPEGAPVGGPDDAADARPAAGGAGQAGLAGPSPKAPAQGGRPPGGAEPAGAAAARGASKSLSTKTLDPADANEDGKVTVKEQQAYDTQWVAKQAMRWAAQQRESAQAQPRPVGEWASARYGAVQALAA